MAEVGPPYQLRIITEDANEAISPFSSNYSLAGGGGRVASPGSRQTQLNPFVSKHTLLGPLTELLLLLLQVLLETLAPVPLLFVTRGGVGGGHKKCGKRKSNEKLVRRPKIAGK